MTFTPPQTREEIIAAFEKQESESGAYWEGFDVETFFRPIGTAWSPAANVRHLIKSVRPVNKALTTPKIVLRFTFGKASRPSMTYDELLRKYSDALEGGVRAGRFTPSSQTRTDLHAWRAEILDSFHGVNRDLRSAIARWPEKKLDSLQLPHPALGKLTVREMLFFTLLHQRHHIGVVQRRLAG